MYAPQAAATAPRLLQVIAVDDDPCIRQMIADYLGDHDIRVTTLGSGKGIDDAMERGAFDLMILDLKLPGEDGFAIARRVREAWDLPIIMLTGRQEEADRIMGLELGADDYLTKPFSPRELLARMRALRRRYEAREATSGCPAKVRAYRFAGWEVNVRLRRVTSPGGQVVVMTNGLFNLLLAFLSSPQSVLTRDQLLGLSRVAEGEVYDRAIDVQVARLRRKLEPEGAPAPLIRTERGAGYVFTEVVDVLH